MANAAQSSSGSVPADVVAEIPKFPHVVVPLGIDGGTLGVGLAGMSAFDDVPNGVGVTGGALSGLPPLEQPLMPRPTTTEQTETAAARRRLVTFLGCRFSGRWFPFSQERSRGFEKAVKIAPSTRQLRAATFAWSATCEAPSRSVRDDLHHDPVRV
jgi:hypothetical protein